jgi:hypothetical protein
MSPEYVAITLRRPRDDDDPGVAAEGWFVQDGDTVQLTDRDGNPLAGGQNTRRLQPGETGRQVAARLIKSKSSRSRHSQPFNRRLRYFQTRF